MKELKITEGPWKIIGDGFDGVDIGVPCKDGFGFHHTATAFEVEDDLEANAKAIVTAVNNTYHKGIDPEGVPEMRKALIKCYEDASDYKFSKETAESIKNALQKAGIPINEKAE